MSSEFPGEKTRAVLEHGIPLFRNGWATNPVGNAHPEVIEAVHQAHKRYGFHYDHPLRYELAEKLLEIMHDAIRHVNENGHDLGDSPAWPTGVAGF